MDNIVRCHLSWLLGSNTVSPKYMWYILIPLLNISCIYFNQAVSDSSIGRFYHSIWLWVISWYSNVTNVIALCNPVQSSNKWSSIVHDNLLKSTPVVQNFVKYELFYCPTSLTSQSLSFWPPSQQIPCLYNIFMPLERWHVYCVDICFSKKWSWNLNHWREYDIFSELDLALMVGRNKPLYITVNSWPSEVVAYSLSSDIEALMI